MSKEFNAIIEDTKKLINAPSCYAELKTKAQTWLDAIGTKEEQDAAKAFITELEGDITKIDNLVAFAHSEQATQIFGDGAKAFAAHADELKASGAKYCDCAACTPGRAILANKNLIIR